MKVSKGFLLAEPIKPEERENKTESGILLTHPKGDRWDLVVTKAKVLEVGVDVDFKKGDIVYYNYFSGNTLLIPSKDATGKNDKELHFVWKEDVLGVEDAGHTEGVETAKN